jgi:hypothetical protein
MTNGIHHLAELEQIIHRVTSADPQSYVMDVRGAFTLQNGGEQLGKAFAHVEREDFESNLRVRQLEPLLDYIASSLDDPAHMETPHAQALIAELDRLIRTDGEIFITKETGLFTARGTL